MNKIPTIFTFNIFGKIAHNFNYLNLIHSKVFLNQITNKQVHLLPIVNSLPSSIEKRSVKIFEDIKSLLQNLNAKEFNLISYSLSGIDSRRTLFLFPELNDKLRRFLTVATPHNGSNLFNNITNCGINFEQVLNYLGVFLSDLDEFNTINMHKLNVKLDDFNDKRYFSINGNIGYSKLDNILKELSNILPEYKLKNSSNDGLFFTEETKLGSHNIAEFYSDHINFGPFSSISNDTVFNFYSDFFNTELNN